MDSIKKILFILLIVFITNCTPKVKVQQDPFAGTTWEMVSAVYTHPDTVLRNPTSEFQNGVAIFGKSHLNVIWQDTSFQYSFFVTHKYEIVGDSLVFFPQLFAEPSLIGKIFKAKYEFDGDQLILDANIPDFSKAHEVWRRVD